MCFHDAMRIHEDTSADPAPVIPSGWRRNLSIEDIVSRNFIPTSSVMIRNGLVGDLPAWYHDLGMGDWPLWVLVTQHGKAGYLDEIMAVYRVHSGGVYSGTPVLEFLPRMLQAYDAIDRGLDYQFHDIVTQSKLTHVLDMVEAICPRFFTGVSIRESVHALDELNRYSDLDPRLMTKLRRRFYAAWFFRAAELGDYQAVRQSLPWLALYDPSRFRDRGVRSITARALLGQRSTDQLRRLSQVAKMTLGE
jgi:hypothetical protein